MLRAAIALVIFSAMAALYWMLAPLFEDDHG